MSVADHIALAERKVRLLERIDAQRRTLATHGTVLKRPLALADNVLQASHFLKERPWVAGVGALVAVVVARRKLFRWVGRGWTLWRGYRFVQRWLHDNDFIKK